MGIKNNKFFLRLYDRRLENIDPHDPNLSIEEQALVFNEVVRNPFYYIREVVRIPVAGGVVPYELQRGNLALTFCMLNNLNIIMLLPRQHGKTIGSIVMYSWLYLFATKNSNMIFVNKELADAKLNLDRLKDIINELPPYLVFTHKDNVDNKEMISNAMNGNDIKVMGPAGNETDADKKGK